MAVKKITRKVISPAKKDSPLESRLLEEKAASIEKVSSSRQDRSVGEKTEETGRTGGASSARGADGTRGADGAKKACSFCQSKTNPVYTDMNILRRFVTERAKLVPKSKSGLCSKHQRLVTKHVKYARHLSLLSFTPKV